jgi:ABC-type transporter Mla MlaB component
MQAVKSAEAHLDGCHSAEVSLAQVNRIDGTGAVLLARLFDRWQQTDAGPASRETTTPRHRDYWRYIADIEPITPLFRHAP